MIEVPLVTEPFVMYGPWGKLIVDLATELRGGLARPED